MGLGLIVKHNCLYCNDDIQKCQKWWQEKMLKNENSTSLNNAETKKRLYTKMPKMLF